MRSIEAFFNYKYTLRFLLVNSIERIANIFMIPCLDKIVCYFPLHALSDLLDARIYNYFYFFKFFFGSSPIFSKFKDVSTFREVQYSFSMHMIIRKQAAFVVMCFFNNDVLPLLASRSFNVDLSYSTHVLRLSYNIHKFNVFIEKKSNLALLNLIDVFKFKLYVGGDNFFSC
jgi:hypothetical protein